jgi:TIR domain
MKGFVMVSFFTFSCKKPPRAERTVSTNSNRQKNFKHLPPVLHVSHPSGGYFSVKDTIELLICYAEEDEFVMKELLRHLGALKRQGCFDAWHDRKITAGMEWAQEKDKHLNTAQIIVLLISQYFLDADYSYKVEMQQAMERHNRGEARVIPVLIRAVFYQKVPFAKLRPLPQNAIPVLSSSWHSLDEALFDVAEGIRKVAEDLSSGSELQ